MPTRQVIILSHTSHIKGGAEKSLLEIIRDLRAQNYDCHVITPPGGDLGGALKELGCSHIPLSFGWWAKGSADTAEFEASDLDNSQALVRIIELIKAVEPAVCITNSIVCPWLAYASAISQVPHLWIIREYGGSDHNLTFRLPLKTVYQTVGTLSYKVFCNSLAMKNFVDKKIHSSRKIGIVYPVVELPEINVSSPSPFDESLEPKLVLVGQIKPGKAQLDAVKAIKECNDHSVNAQLCLVGDEEDKAYAKQIKDFVTANGLQDKVIFSGHQKNPFNILQHADIALGTSRHEAFGRTVKEAMLVNKPVIAANNDGFSEVIKDGLTGLLYKVGDPKDLSEKITLLHKNPDLASALTKAAKKDASARFSRQKAHKELLDCVQELGDPKKARPHLDTSLPLILFSPLLELRKLTENLSNTQVALDHTQKLLEHKSEELNNIYGSRAWVLVSLYRRILGKIFSRR